MQWVAQSCPVFPSRCSFGGACHACPARVQAKLTVSDPGDEYEHEADRVADQVMSTPEPRSALATATSSRADVHRACDGCDEEVQRQAEDEEEETAQTKPLAAQITPLVQRQAESAGEDEEEVPVQAKSVVTEPVPLGHEAEQAKHAPVPGWRQLPDYVRVDLGRAELDEKWFDDHDDELRLTVLNLYVKLKGMGLWRFIGWNEPSTKKGCFHFLTPSLEAFRAVLRQSDDFSSPQAPPRGYWNSREMRSSGSLEFKHFRGWPVEKVEAHIDQIGLLPKSKWWWLMPPIPLGHMAAHGLAYDSFEDVFGIRGILLAQGWDPQPLLGIGASVAQRKECTGDDPMHNTKMQPRVRSSSSAGQPLPIAVRAFFEPRLGYDFGGVRVHSDMLAAETASALNARAYTVGRDIVFGAQQYAPQTTEGRRLLAHELTHVAQQDHATLLAPNSLAVGRPCDAFEQEAHEVARSIPDQAPVVEPTSVSLSSPQAGNRLLPGSPRALLKSRFQIVQAWWIDAHAPSEVRGQTHELITESVLGEAPLGSVFSADAKAFLRRGSAEPDVEKSDVQRQLTRELTAAIFHGWSVEPATVDHFVGSFVRAAADYLNAGRPLEFSLREVLGKALHAAQDKAAHLTHCTVGGRECTSVEQDNPLANRGGWSRAFENTRNVFRMFFHRLTHAARSRMRPRG